MNQTAKSGPVLTGLAAHEEAKRCRIKINLARDRNLHPNGKEYVAIKNVKNVYEMVEEVPLREYRRTGVKVEQGWNTLVSPSNIDAAFGLWNGERELVDDERWKMEAGGMDPNWRRFMEVVGRRMVADRKN